MILSNNWAYFAQYFPFYVEKKFIRNFPVQIKVASQVKLSYKTNLSPLIQTLQYFRYLLKVVYLIKIWFRTFQDSLPSGWTLRYMTYNVSIPESIFLSDSYTSRTLHSSSPTDIDLLVFSLSQSRIIQQSTMSMTTTDDWPALSFSGRLTRPEPVFIKWFGALEKNSLYLILLRTLFQISFFFFISINTTNKGVEVLHIFFVKDQFFFK